MDSNLETKNEPARLNNSSRSGGYFAKKDEKDKAIQEERRKKMIKKVSWGLVILAGLGLLTLPVYNYFKKATVNQVNVSGEYFQSQSRDHIPVGQSHDAYNSNPPTGGWHYETSVQTGIYDTFFPDEQIVHNLEHSHVWIAYKPNLPVDQIEKLADIAKTYGSKIIMTSREANDTPIAIVAWEHLLKIESFDEARIKGFIDAYRGIAGPEKIPDSGFKDFRKK